jgi:hypothetical protein
VVAFKNGIDGLNENNVMPAWWNTQNWRRQYPAGTSVQCEFNNETLRRNGDQDSYFKLCPPLSAPNKAVQPFNNKRHRSAIEIAVEKKETKEKKKIKRERNKQDEDKANVVSQNKLVAKKRVNDEGATLRRSKRKKN